MRIANIIFLGITIAILTFLPLNGSAQDSTPMGTSEISEPIGEVEMELIKEMLATANLTLSDLSFEKKWAEDGNRLSIVNRLMDYPLETPNYIHQRALEVRDAGENLQRLLRLTAEPLDLRTPTEVYKETARVIDSPDALARSCASFLAVFKDKIHSLWEDAGLSEEEMIALIYNLPYIWVEEEKYEALGYGAELGRTLVKFAFPQIDDAKLESLEKAEKMKPEEILSLVNKIDRQRFMQVADEFIFSAEFFANAGIYLAQHYAENNAQRAVEGVSGEVAGFFEEDGVRVVIGGKSDNEYFENFDAIIDLGGNDKYLAKEAGGVNGAQILIDLGGGEDFYSAKQSFCFGSAVAGLAYLMDDGGNDTFRANSYSIGSALLGYSFFHDRAGDDIYQGDVHTEGAGTFGVSIFVDGGLFVFPR